MLVVPRSDYTDKVPVIVGTNILRLGMELVHCLDDDISIPKQWDVAFSSIQDNSSGVVRSSNKRPFKLFPSSVMTISGIVKLKDDANTESLVTENRSILSELSDQVVVCPRVVSVKGSGKQSVPVRICNITAKHVVIKPKTFLYELSGVTVVRDGFDEHTLSGSETINEGKESLEELGINVREDLPDSTKELFSDAVKAICEAILVSSSCPPAESICMSQTLEGIVDKVDPELDTFSDISWILEQKKDEDIARVLELKRAGHKPTKREIGKQPLGVDRDVSQGKSHESYASQLEKRLQYAYKTAAKVAEKASRRHKTRYDLKVRNSVLKKGDRVLLKNIHIKGRQKLANRWNREPFIVVSKPDINIPVYVVKPEYGKSKSKTKTVHRNLLLAIYSLPTEELVPHSKKERNRKCTSETNRVDDEIQIVESVKDTECTGSIHEYSDQSDSDSDYALMPFVQPGQYKAIPSSSLNPSAEEFSPLSLIVSGSQRNQTHDSDIQNLSNGTGNASSTSGTHTGLSSEHIDETLNTSSRLTHEQSSLIAHNSDISNEASSVPESTHVPVEQFTKPVLRRTARQSRKPDRYGMYSSSYIFASSRGSSMSQVDCKQVNIIPGGTYDRLCSLAEKLLHNIVHPKIVYFVAGNPDICSLVRIKNDKNEESYLYLELHVTLIQEAMSDVEKRMKNIGCKVVFATITTMSFQKWNTHRKFIGKIVRLKYESDYERMQEQLNKILHSVNTYIVQRNLGNGVVTPFLHAFVHKRCKRKIRYIYSMLVDGVHPTQALSASWARHMEATMDKNERNL
ncbi:unnamed protein product [Mytilus coruscus]|uniref:Uncharacterized protein n=1 Tax=Mytilus coruscus TaxID=42192 RepID=A0A6J8C7W7_MYTCO|nr:unnamed protein product [Mytilus coruscus]